MQSRYYNPDWGRFINADAIIGQTGELLGHNMFAYCKNNFINLKDSTGFRPMYTIDEETDDMINASLESMNSHNTNYGSAQKSLAETGLEQTFNMIENSESIASDVANKPFAKATTGITNTVIFSGANYVVGAFISGGQYIADGCLEYYQKPQTIPVETKILARGSIYLQAHQSAKYYGMMLIWDDVNNYVSGLGVSSEWNPAKRGCDF